MAIDPIAVTGGAAAKMPTNADVSAQTNAAAHNGSQSSQSSAPVGSSETIDLFNFTNQQNQQAIPMDALSADGKAQYYANPTTLGEEVLNYLEGFHERIVDFEPLSTKINTSNSETGGDALSTGPASIMPSPSSAAVEGSTGADQASSSGDRFDLLIDVMEEAGFRHTESNLVANVGQQFSRSMSTLMRGQ